MDGVRFTKPTRAVNDIKFLTVEEQKFLAAAQKSYNYYQYALILETGLRTGELIGLTSDSVDWKKRTLTVNKTLEFRHKQHEWRAGPPKTKKSYRTIPLTDTAYQILRDLYLGREHRKEAPELDKVLTYIDRRTAKQAELHMRNLVFINYRTGMPAKNSSYDTHLYKLCDRAGIEHFCVCTPCGIPMLPAPLKAGCSRRCCKSCSVMPASKQQWTDMSTSHLNPWIRLCGYLNQTGFPI